MPSPPFSGDHSVTFSQGRRGEVYVYQGFGYSGQVWSPSLNSWRQVGLDGPKLLATEAHRKPTITQSAGVKYYVARIDITNSGAGYEVPPAITIDSTNYSNSLAAKAITRIRDGYVSAVEVTDYGKGYSSTPSAVFSSPVGVLDGTTVLTPPKITSNQNDFNLTTGATPSGTVGEIYELTATIPVFITGVTVTGTAKPILLRNVGTKNITLKHNSASSIAANRIFSPTYADIVLSPNEQVTLTNLPSPGGWQAVLSAPYSSVGPTKATAQVVVRAHLRGRYQCYFRYVNESVPEAEGGPLYSDLSEVTEVDCGDGKEYITWSGTGITGATGKTVELWRTTSNQATTLYRIAKQDASGNWVFGGLQDSLTDWELLDSTRAGWQAMPILLPNGELNANRFGVPPKNYSSAVMFQDRLWMGVDTGGENSNTLRFSEGDEPESIPDTNELILQSNLRATDYITALVPYAGSLIVMQSRHCHRLTYVAQPLIDTGISLLAYRGCLNQRCWDIYEGRVFSMDDQGVYAMDPNGQIEDLTLGIADYFIDKIDFSLREWFMVRVDRRYGLVRVSVAVKGDGSAKYPSRMLVYSLDYKSWWEERYPAELTCATDIRTSVGDVVLTYGTSNAELRVLNETQMDLADGCIFEITITNPGYGYKQPPVITASGGHGAEFECGINSDGKITGILCKVPGTKYSNGSLTIQAPPTGGTQATATYTVASGSQPVYWTYKSGAFEYTTDTVDKKAGEVQSRHCSLTYQPTPLSCTLNLKAYYNNARYPRSNVVRRDRGTGFVHSDSVPAATLNMQATPLQEAESHAVARALFSGRTLDDMMGSDRHVSIALSGQQIDTCPVAIHTLDIYGVNDKGGG